jgi:hypothetical protein
MLADSYFNKAGDFTMSVLQPWVERLPLMQQSVLISSVRGPDTLAKYHLSKYLLRWFRRCVLISAFEKTVLTDPHDPRGGSFTGPIESESLDELASHYLRSVDELPLHFHLHFVHAAEIVGYKHPDDQIREWWRNFYLAAVRDMHLHHESEEELDQRLGDNLNDWQTMGGDGEVLTGRLSSTRQKRKAASRV